MSGDANGLAPFCRAAESRRPAAIRARREHIRRYGRISKRSIDLIPGDHRFNLHAMYGDFGDRCVDRDGIEPEHFRSWTDWARKIGVGIDFNCTLFSHPKADSGYTLSSRDAGIRHFWIEHVKRCREIGSYIGRELGSACIHNIWIPDGSKDLTVNRYAHRALLKESLDTIFRTRYDPKYRLKMRLNQNCSASAWRPTPSGRMNSTWDTR